MFNDSIAANVALGRDVDLQRVHECLAAANPLGLCGRSAPRG